MGIAELSLSLEYHVLHVTDDHRSLSLASLASLRLNGGASLSSFSMTESHDV